MAFELGVNYTAGLPIVRTSPDHGAAYSMAGRDQADPRSMLEAIYTALDVYRNRQIEDDLQEGKMTIKTPDTEIRPRGGRIIE
jgi:4-hydroxythreonine-4-phosphate dehydrogenase